MLDRGADVLAVDKSGLTPLHCAAKRAHKEVVEFLLAQGADVHIVDKDGKKALDYLRRDDIKVLLQ